MVHDKERFNKWLATFTDCIYSYDYYVDFEKVYRQAKQCEFELNCLNILIGKQDIEKQFRNAFKKYNGCVKAIPILLAKRILDIRNETIDCYERETGIKTFSFSEPYESVEDYILFMNKTGLFDLMKNSKVKNLYDYVVGVEVGLDSNARKNRGGKQMAALVKSYIDETGCNSFAEMTSAKIHSNYSITLPETVKNKRWDYVVESPKKIFAIEVNYYSGGGSKLNETARSYLDIVKETRGIPRFEFIWITDGLGWKDAKNSLFKTYEETKHLYNLNDLKKGVLKKVFAE